MSKENGIASPEDFKNAASVVNPPERVALPKSGLVVLLRRPTAFGVWMLDQRVEELKNSERFLEWRELICKCLEDAVVQPKLSLQPGPGEIHPDWLPEEDQVFLVRWVRGLIAPDGTDLVEKFFRDRGRPPVGPTAGASGGDAALPAVGAARSNGPSGTED